MCWIDAMLKRPIPYDTVSIITRRGKTIFIYLDKSDELTYENIYDIETSNDKQKGKFLKWLKSWVINFSHQENVWY